MDDTGAKLFKMFQQTSLARRTYMANYDIHKKPYSVDAYVNIISRITKKKIKILELNDSVG